MTVKFHEEIVKKVGSYNHHATIQLTYTVKSSSVSLCINIGG